MIPTLKRPSVGVVEPVPGLPANQRRWRLVAGLLPAVSGTDMARSQPLEPQREEGGQRMLYLSPPPSQSSLPLLLLLLLTLLSAVLTHGNSDNLTLWKSWLIYF